MRDVETGLLQAPHRTLQVDQSLLCTRLQDSQRARERKMTPLGLLPPATFIDDELIGPQLFG